MKSDPDKIIFRLLVDKIIYFTVLSVDCMRSCLLPTVITVGVTILLLLATCGSAVLVWKRCKKSGKSQTLRQDCIQLFPVVSSNCMI